MNKEDIIQCISKIFKNKFDIIEFHELLWAISSGKEKVESNYIGSGSYGFAFKFIKTN